MKLIASTLNLIFNIITSPRDVFESVQNNKLYTETFIVFIVAGMITFTKSFLIGRTQVNFFAREELNQLISWLNIPQINWLMVHIIYFGFIYLISVLCKYFNKGVNLKTLFVSIMAISGIGIVMQVIFSLLSIIAPAQILVYASLGIWIWVAFLTILAIKITQLISFGKAIMLFAIAALPCILWINLVGISPYLAWIV